MDCMDGVVGTDGKPGALQLHPQISGCRRDPEICLDLGKVLRCPF